MALSFGARVARIESERNVDCSLRFELHLESFTTALADHQRLYVALVRVLTHSPLDPNASAENASSLTGRQTEESFVVALD